jgi:TonB family protein
MSLLLEATIKVSLIILFGIGLATLLRRRSAAVRHWVLATAIVCAAALPAIQLVVPAWAVRLSSDPAVSRAPQPRTTSGEAPLAQEKVSVSAIAIQSADTDPEKSGIGVLAAIWMAGVVLSLSLLIVGLLRLAWLASHATLLIPGSSSGSWTRIADEVAREYGLRRSVRLLQTDHPSLLVTWGLVSPKVILPRAAEGWSDDRIRIVLRHELAHIRRGDWVMQLAGELLRAIYWFNPLLILACTALRLESEQACDDEVLKAGVDGSDYATHLLELARALKADRSMPLPAPAIVRSSSLERRIRAMLNARLIRNPTTRSVRLATVAALSIVTVAVAAAQTGAAKLSGSVFDPTGAAVPGTQIVLTNSHTQAKYEVKSDQTGYFEFVPLPADEYVLEARIPGFESLKDSVRLAGQNVRRDLTLSLGKLVETITITGGPSAAPGNNAPSRQLDRSGFERALKECTASPVGGRVRPPRKIKDVKPVYPAALQEAGVEGTVVLKGTVGTDGTFRELQVVKSVHPDLDSAAIDAVKQWQFDGTLLNCVPVEVAINVTVNFNSR